MDRAALLISVTLLLVGVTWAHRTRGQPRLSDSPQEGDAASPSNNQPARPVKENGSSGPPEQRRPLRFRTRRRRPLNPERRRQIMLRRQRLGLPVRNRLRTRSRLTKDKVQETPRTSPSLITSTRTSTSLSSSSMSSSFSSSSRPRFPSFSVASKLRNPAKKTRPGWGLKLAEAKGASGETNTALDARRSEAGSHVVLRRPAHRRLTPTPVLTPTTTLTPSEDSEEDERLRYRPSLVGKKTISKSKLLPTTRTPGYSSEPQQNPYESVAPELSTTEPYYSETEAPEYEEVTRNTPKPKKVTLEPLTTTLRTDYESPYEPLDSVTEPLDTIPEPLDSIYGPQESVSVTQTEFPQVTAHSPDSQNAPGLRYSPLAQDSQNASGLRYSPLTQDSENGLRYAPEPQDLKEHAPEDIYAPDPIYSGEEYSDYEETPGIFDHYKYGYNVESADTGNYQERYEARDGSTVSGSYKVALPDGRVQVVTYVADDQGFRAEVTYEGQEVTQSKIPAPKTTAAPRPPAPQGPRPGLGHSPRGPRKLHFDYLVETVSPNPFRLVVDRAQASTVSPPTTAEATTPTATTPTPPAPATRLPTPTADAPLVGSDPAETYTLLPHTADAHAATPTPVYQYASGEHPGARTVLYSPEGEATAYIHARGRSHQVPVLLPYPPRPHGDSSFHPRPQGDSPYHPRPQGDSPFHPRPQGEGSLLHPRPHGSFPSHPRPHALSPHIRTYYLTQGEHSASAKDAESVEIVKGDASRPRLSIKIPEPHESDIYPVPARPFHLFWPARRTVTPLPTV